MSTRRKTDPLVGHSSFRTERIVQDGGLWYFHTREGTVEGPFSCRTDAINQLEVYIKLAVHDLLPLASYKTQSYS